MSLWDCAECGCRAIAHGLGFCPQCYTPKGEDMPKITSGGASNAWEPQPVPGEPDGAAPAEPDAEPVTEDAAPPADPEPAPAAPETPPAPKAAPASPKRSAPPSAPQGT